MSRISAKMKCPRKVKQDLLTKIREDVQIAADEGDRSVLSLESAFGAPEEIANSYILSLDQKELSVKLKKAWFGRTILIIALSAVLLAVTIFVMMLIESGQHTTYYTDTEIGVVEGR